MSYLDARIATNEDPRRFDKALKANFSGLWRYRVENYRILCQILDHELIMLVIAVGHRRHIYD